MSDKPLVTPGQRINIGGHTNAVVTSVYDSGNIEIVYIGTGGKAINEDAKWSGDSWEFAIQGPCGGYADNYTRLDEYVRILRSNHR